MIHHRQRLPIGFKPSNHLLGVHARLAESERDPLVDWLGLLSDIDDARVAFLTCSRSL
jgi:hypothetical protein